MNHNENKVTQPRKAYAKRGNQSQKMLAFRCDLDCLEWLNLQSNKGRVINDLIHEAMNKNKGGD